MARYSPPSASWLRMGSPANQRIQAKAYNKAYAAGVRVGSHAKALRIGTHNLFGTPTVAKLGRRSRVAALLAGSRVEPSIRARGFVSGYGVGRGIWDPAKHPRAADGKFT